MRSTLVSFLLLVTMAFGFQQPMNPSSRQALTVCHGLFDGFINSMEAGYKGEDSAFQKQKAADEKKREEKRKQADARKARGYTELKDSFGKKTFVKVKYEEPAEPAKEEKKFFGLF